MCLICTEYWELFVALILSELILSELIYGIIKDVYKKYKELTE